MALLASFAQVFFENHARELFPRRILAGMKTLFETYLLDAALAGVLVTRAQVDGEAVGFLGHKSVALLEGVDIVVDSDSLWRVVSVADNLLREVWVVDSL